MGNEAQKGIIVEEQAKLDGIAKIKAKLLEIMTINGQSLS